MKKFLLTAATAAATLTAFSADKFYVIMKDGSVESYPTEKVDSISFNDPQIEKIMGFGDMMQEIAKLREEIAALKSGAGVQDTSVSDLRYNIISDSEVEVADFNTGTPNLVVPEKVTLFGKEYTVTRFSASAFDTYADTSSTYSFVKTVVLPKSIKSIAGSVFGGLKEVTSYSVDPENPYYSSLDGILYDKKEIIRVPKNVSGTIEFPAFVSEFDKNHFEKSSLLTAVNVDPENPYYTSVDGIVYDKEKTTVIFAPRGIKGDIVIPEGVESIGYEAFAGCKGLTSIKIPSSLTDISGSAFLSCSGLTSMVLPSNVKSIGWAAFSGCSGLTSMVLPSSVKSIGWAAFSGCEKLDVVCEFSRDDVNLESSDVFEDCKSVVFKGEWKTEKSVDWSNRYTYDVHVYDGRSEVYVYKVKDEYLVKNESKNFSFSVSFSYEEGERGVYEYVSNYYIQVDGKKFEISENDNSYLIWTESEGFEVVTFSEAKNISKDVVLVYSDIDKTISSPSVQSTLQQLKTTESLISKDYSNDKNY